MKSPSPTLLCSHLLFLIHSEKQVTVLRYVQSMKYALLWSLMILSPLATKPPVLPGGCARSSFQRSQKHEFSSCSYWGQAQDIVVEGALLNKLPDFSFTKVIYVVYIEVLKNTHHRSRKCWNKLTHTPPSKAKHTTYRGLDLFFFNLTIKVFF